jgi:hypothetical protein
VRRFDDVAWFSYLGSGSSGFIPSFVVALLLGGGNCCQTRKVEKSTAQINGT